MLFVAELVGWKWYRRRSVFRSECMSVLRLQHLSRPGLRPVDLTVTAGECLCISGPSGAGKSLLLRAIADLDPHGGEVWLDDQACSAMTAPDWRRQVGYLAAESAWWAETVGDHFRCDAETRLRSLGLHADFMSYQVSRLSTGERQRLALVRLLCQQPRVLLLDEPTASLDPQAVMQVEGMIAEYRQNTAAAVVWVSHDTAQIARVAQRHFRMVAGELQEAPLAAAGLSGG